MVRIWTISTLVVALGASVLTQPSVDPARAAGIGVMRAINTAEAATRQETGKYAELADLINHRIMGRVRADIMVNGAAISYHGQPLRLLLSPDGLQYQAMLVPIESCGTAIFSDERGMIYTGKVLDCK